MQIFSKIHENSFSIFIKSCLEIKRFFVFDGENAFTSNEEAFVLCIKVDLRDKIPITVL